MRKARERQRAIVALIGTIMLVTSLALAAGSIRPTEAQWEDKAYGESVFGTADNAGLNYARALATYGTFARPLSPLERIGPAHQLDTNTTNPTAAPFQESTMRFRDVGFLGLINMSVTGATCARSDQASLAPCPSNTPPIPAGAASFASGSANGLRISTGLGLLPLARYTDTLRTTASCTPGRVGTVAVERNGDLVLGAWPGTTSVPIPVAGEGQRIARSTASHRETGLYTYTATVTHVKEIGVGYAKSDMYLELHSDTTLGDSERWSLIIDLTSAECGLSRDPGNAPGYPTANAGVPQVLARNSLVTTEAMSPFVNAVELQNLDEVATPTPVKPRSAWASAPKAKRKRRHWTTPRTTRAFARPMRTPRPPPLRARHRRRRRLLPRRPRRPLHRPPRRRRRPRRARPFPGPPSRPAANPPSRPRMR